MSRFLASVNRSNIEDFFTRLESKRTPNHDYDSNDYQNDRRCLHFRYASILGRKRSRSLEVGEWLTLQKGRIEVLRLLERE